MHNVVHDLVGKENFEFYPVSYPFFKIKHKIIISELLSPLLFYESNKLYVN